MLSAEIDIERAYAEIRKGFGRGLKRKETITPATLLRLHSVLKAAPNTAVRRKSCPTTRRWGWSSSR